MNFLDFCDIDINSYKKYKLHTIYQIDRLKLENKGNGIIEGSLFLKENTKPDTALINWVEKNTYVKISGNSQHVTVYSVADKSKSAKRKITKKDVQNALKNYICPNEVLFLHVLSIYAHSVANSIIRKQYHGQKINEFPQEAVSLETWFNCAAIKGTPAQKKHSKIIGEILDYRPIDNGG